MKNCRNCKWAAWSKSDSGRRRFGNYATCGYVVTVTLPASRYRALDELSRPVPVREYAHKPVDCAVWESCDGK